MYFLSGPLFYRIMQPDLVFVHKATTLQKQFLHHVFTYQKGDMYSKIPNGYFVEKGFNNTWKKYYCDDEMECKEIGAILNDMARQFTENDKDGVYRWTQKFLVENWNSL